MTATVIILPTLVDRASDRIDRELDRDAPTWAEDAVARISHFIADPVQARVRRIIGEQE